MMSNAPKIRFMTIDPATKETGSTTGYVVWSSNHLNQKRQFAFDGRFWYYQPTTRSNFQKVGKGDLPGVAVDAMANHTGIDKAKLLEE